MRELPTSFEILKGTKVGPRQHANKVVVVAIERGYAILSSDELDRINLRFELIERIARCSTWGDYRALGHHELEGHVRDHVLFEEEIEDDEPPDDKAFSISLREADPEDSFLDQDAALELATGDFLGGIGEETFPQDAVEKIGPWSFVTGPHL